jgi:hypothetical protein
MTVVIRHLREEEMTHLREAVLTLYHHHNLLYPEAR